MTRGSFWLGRLWRAVGAGFASLVCAAAISAAPVPRIVAIGDLHGDFVAWRAIAGAAGLIDAQGAWTGGKTILVQTGDVVDRGPDSIDIVRDLMRLQHEAHRAGGRVIALVGNHEAMNMTDDLRYVTPADYAAFADARSADRRDRVYAANQATIEQGYRTKNPTMTREAIHQAWLAANPLGLIEHQSAWHPGGMIGQWVMSNPAVVRIGDTVFVHGGISPAYAHMRVSEMNRHVADALAARDTDPGSIINDPAGPLWYRGLAADPSPAIAAELDQILHALGAMRMVIAHTPRLAGIAILYDGKLARIDTGISIFYGGPLTWLEILGDRMTPHELARPAGPRGGNG